MGKSQRNFDTTCITTLDHTNYNLTNKRSEYEQTKCNCAILNKCFLLVEIIITKPTTLSVITFNVRTAVRWINKWIANGFEVIDANTEPRSINYFITIFSF